jgi:hypothetical protein
MATINQIKKQIETAEKRISDFDKKIALYLKRCDNAINALNKKGATISEHDIKEDCKVIGTYKHYDYTIDKEIVEFWGWEETYRITNNYSSAKENQRNKERGKKNLERLQEELRLLTIVKETKEKAYDNTLQSSLESVLAKFKEEWIIRMMDWNEKHYDYIHENLDVMKIRLSKAKKLQYYFQYSRNHGRTFSIIEREVKKCARFVMDKAANLTKEKWVEECHAKLIEEWNQGIVTLTEKCQEFGIDKENVGVSIPRMGGKGIQVLITDNKDRVIDARVIWAAEDSVLVEPHTRYIVTERKH